MVVMKQLIYCLESFNDFSASVKLKVIDGGSRNPKWILQSISYVVCKAYTAFEAIYQPEKNMASPPLTIPCTKVWLY